MRSSLDDGWACQQLLFAFSPPPVPRDSRARLQCCCSAADVWSAHVLCPLRVEVKVEVGCRVCAAREVRLGND
jgi:hypothetical protein